MVPIDQPSTRGTPWRPLSDTSSHYCSDIFGNRRPETTSSVVHCLTRAPSTLQGLLNHRTSRGHWMASGGVAAVSILGIRHNTGCTERSSQAIYKGGTERMRPDNNGGKCRFNISWSNKSVKYISSNSYTSSNIHRLWCSRRHTVGGGGGGRMKLSPKLDPLQWVYRPRCIKVTWSQLAEPQQSEL